MELPQYAVEEKEGKRPMIPYRFTQCPNGCSLGSLPFPRQDNHVQRCVYCMYNTFAQYGVFCEKKSSAPHSSQNNLNIMHTKMKKKTQHGQKHSSHIFLIFVKIDIFEVFSVGKYFRCAKKTFHPNFLFFWKIDIFEVFSVGKIADAQQFSSIFFIW